MKKVLNKSMLNAKQSVIIFGHHRYNGLSTLRLARPSRLGDTWMVLLSFATIENIVYRTKGLTFFLAHPPWDYLLHTSQSTPNSIIHLLAQIFKRAVDDPTMDGCEG